MPSAIVTAYAAGTWVWSKSLAKRKSKEKRKAC